MSKAYKRRRTLGAREVLEFGLTTIRAEALPKGLFVTDEQLARARRANAGVEPEPSLQRVRGYGAWRRDWDDDKRSARGLHFAPRGYR